MIYHLMVIDNNREQDEESSIDRRYELRQKHDQMQKHLDLSIQMHGIIIQINQRKQIHLTCT